MIKVYQECIHAPHLGSWGDCHRACIASILELPLFILTTVRKSIIG